MDAERIEKLQAGYDEVADAYVERIYGELAHKPLDRELLDAFAAEMKEQTLRNYLEPSVVLDIGCGPGHVSRYLHERGVAVLGMDLSAKMVANARRLNPDITFLQGDMTSLASPDKHWNGIVAFYSLIHVPRTEIVETLRGLHRILCGNGLLFLAFHLGDEDLHVEDLWGHRVSLDFVLYQTSEMKGYLESAGFEVQRVTERDPYPDVEYPSRRSYIMARKPGRPR